MRTCILIFLVGWVGCTPRQPASLITDAFLNVQPVETTIASFDEAHQIQTQLVAALQAASYGPVIGYKAGLTSPAAQATFGVTEPVLGVLLDGMLIESGRTLPASFGVRPRFEGDLLVRIGDTSINTAQTDAELAEALDAVLPFIELPDLMYAEEVAITGPNLVAINVGGRLGVQGTPIALPADRETLDLLATIKLVLTTENDTLATAVGTSLLGHPIHAVRWIRDRVVASGNTLDVGHVISLGSMTPLFTPEAGQTVRATYRIDGQTYVIETTFD
ncbi:MAG: hypothetical protein RhofKO_19070 [Rhodothermales bacterium]